MNKYVYDFSVPQDYKLNPGAVESIFEQPNQPNNILVGYNRGLIVLWNRVDNSAVKTFIANQQLEALCWKEDGRNFLSAHNDGKPKILFINDYTPFTKLILIV